MDLQIDLFPKTEFAMQRPIQCEGAARGPARMSEVAVTGSVNPQINWGNVLGAVGQIAPIAAGLL